MHLAYRKECAIMMHWNWVSESNNAAKTAIISHLNQFERIIEPSSLSSFNPTHYLFANESIKEGAVYMYEFSYFCVTWNICCKMTRIAFKSIQFPFCTILLLKLLLVMFYCVTCIHIILHTLRQGYAIYVFRAWCASTKWIACPHWLPTCLHFVQCTWCTTIKFRMLFWQRPMQCRKYAKNRDSTAVLVKKKKKIRAYESMRRMSPWTSARSPCKTIGLRVRQTKVRSSTNESLVSLWKFKSNHQTNQ